jgi:S-adenosylmethionine uptake transporter
MYRSILGFISTTTFYQAIEILPLSLGVTLYYTTPIFTSIFCYLFLGEKLGKLEILSILSALFGVVLLTKPELIFHSLKEEQ